MFDDAYKKEEFKYLLYDGNKYEGIFLETNG